jgi:arylsulfatase A-like enzyme
MNRLATRILFALGGLAVVLVGVSCAPPEPPGTVILISIDALRGDGLSVYGNPRPLSPNLDQLAREGVRFRQAYATAPWTIPSHASMLTGLYPMAVGAHARRPLPAGLLTLPEHLRRNGSRTAALVNAPYLDRKFGFDRGFDEFRFLKPRKDLPDNVDAALEFLGRNRAVSTFLFLHVFDVHAPYQPPEPFDRMYVDEATEPDGTIPFLRQVGYHHHLKSLEEAPSVANLRARYDAGVARVDRELGRLIQGLRDLEIYDDTLIIVTADHGEAFFERQVWVGHGLFLYDEELRIPLIMKFPSRFGWSGVEVDDTVSLVDIMPTVLEALQLDPLPALQGESLIPSIESGRRGEVHAPERPVLGSSSHLGDAGFVRSSRWKYIEAMKEDPDEVIRRHLRPSDEVAAELRARVISGAQLYDLVDDPGETRNLVGERPDVVQELKAMLEAHQAASLRIQQAFTAGEEPELTEEEKKHLRSLGYVD